MTQTGESGGSGPALLSCALKPKPEARQGVRTLTLRETEAHSQSLRHHLEIPVSRRRAPSSHAAPGLEKSSSQSCSELEKRLQFSNVTANVIFTQQPSF